jgi:hypothetical protein
MPLRRAAGDPNPPAVGVAVDAPPPLLPLEVAVRASDSDTVPRRSVR